MAEFTSNTIPIKKSNGDIYHFLNDFNNFEKLLPEQVINWQSTQNSCSFTIKGMADLAMVLGECNEPDLVVYKSVSPSPFEFSMKFNLSSKGPSADVYCNLEAKLNPMLKMMASRPLQNFVNILVEKLKETLES